MKKVIYSLNTYRQFSASLMKTGLKFIVMVGVWTSIASATLAQTTITLTAIADNWLEQADPTRNKGICVEASIGGGAGDLRHMILKFDLSAIPVGVSITSATLSLAKTGSDDNAKDIEVRRMTGDWMEGGACDGAGISSNWNTSNTAVNWGTPGGDYAATVYATTSVTTETIYNWAVTSLIQQWYNGTYQNYGLLMKYSDEGLTTDKTFAARENATPANRPILTITYTLPAGYSSLTKSIAASSDDAEEYGADGGFPVGTMSLNSTDLEMTQDIEPTTSGTQKIGLRFNSITVPKGATITGAYLVFGGIPADAPNTNTGATSLTIKGQAIDNAPTFTTTTNNISGRTLTTASSSWTPTAWVSGTTYYSASINSEVQELVTRTGWVSGNSLALVITGTGSRSASSWDGAAGNGSFAPQLVITYSVPVISGVVTNVSCFGGNNGGINISISGGTGPYTYDWSYNTYPDNTFPDPEDATGRTAGTYSVRVRDALGAISTANFTIGQPNVLALSTIVTPSSGGADGAIDLTVTGGNSPYTYSWSSGALTQDISGLVAGTYSVTVTDTKSCTAQTSVTVSVAANQTTVNKYLYLSDPSQALDRVDPVATNDLTFSLSGILSTAPEVIVDATSSNYVTSLATPTPFTISHTTGNGNSRLMLVGISWRDGNAPTVTYGGVSVPIYNSNVSNGNARMAIYRLVAPAIGTANVSVVFPSNVSRGAVVGVMTFFGVDQTTPLGAFNSAGGNTVGPATVNIASVSGDLVFATATVQNDLFNVAGGGAGQAERWRIKTGSEISGLGTTKPATTTSTTMSWTLSASDDWVIGGVAIKPATAVTNTTFTQSPVLCSNLIIKAGAIAVRTYVNVLSGTMPANPSITALLKYGATNIISLTSPVYTSTSATAGYLTWTGTLGADVTVPSGNAIALQVTTAHSGVAFQIKYDHKDFPSKITIPVSTYINIGTLAIYDAPYSGGTSITSGYNTGTYFSRITVTDPFGNTDIKSLTVKLKTPGGAVFSTTTLTSPVASPNSCTKIFQSTLTNLAILGTWTVQAIATEGTEGVEYSTSMSFTIDEAPPGGVIKTKSLYLSTDGTGSPDQDLDRVDPVATADVSNALSEVLGSYTATITQGTVTTGLSASATSISFAHTTVAGTNRLMLVGISWSPNDGETINSVTYNGIALTLVPSSSAVNSNTAAVAIYYLKEATLPASGNVVITFNEVVQEGIVAGAQTFAGVNQSTTFGTAVATTGSSTAPSVTVSSANGELVFGVEDNRDNVTATIVGGETKLWDFYSGERADGVGFTEPGAASVTSSFTLGSSKAWAIAAVPIKPATVTGVSTTSFTQIPSMCSDLVVKDGQTVTAKLYVSVLNGTMTGSSAVVGTVKFGATTIASLSNAGYSGGILTLSGTVTGGDKTVPAGQAVVLDVTNNQSGLGFQIQFDSQTYPSRIDLPTNTYIDITSFAMYDGAYPGGSVITNADNTSTVYLRATVSDPFGVSDITGLSIDISGPAGSTTVSAGSVATSTCTLTYEYAWAPSLGAGEYTFFAKAKEGYETGVSEVVDFSYKSFSLCPLTVVATETTRPSCTYPSGGIVTLDIQNGAGPYTWTYTGTSGGSGSGTEITGLAPGTYNITVTSAGGCTGNTSVTVNSPSYPSVSLTVNPAGCQGNDGSINASASGGYGNNNFSYFWTDNGATTPNRTGLVPGTYTVIVTDLDNGCTDEESGTIILTNIISGSAFVTNVSCNGGNNGTINLTPTGGSGIYFSYNWTATDGGVVPPAQQSSQDLTGLTAGFYTVEIHDNGSPNCVGYKTFQVTEPAVIIINHTDVQPECYAGGSITLSVDGGTAPYTYDWADLAGTSNVKDRVNIPAGTYTVTVTDAKGCSANQSVTLYVPTCDPTAITVCTSNTAQVFSVPPDPDVISYTWTVPAGVVIVSGQGSSVIVVDWSGATVSSGLITVVSVNDCGESSATIIITYIGKPDAIATATTACTGSSFQLVANGGVTYSWTGPNSFTSNLQNPIIHNASAFTHNGNYTVTVTDANGCSATATVSVAVQPNPTAVATVIDATCSQVDGEIDITPSGGTPDYTYLWSTGDMTQDIDNIPAGPYSVLITDAIGCQYNLPVNVNNLLGPTVTLTGTNASCYGGSDGTISPTVTGGTSPYTYQWSNGATTATVSGLPAGQYNVTVTDATGCIAAASIEITQPLPIVIDGVVTNVNCNGGSNGTVNITVTGGTPNGSVPYYTFAWEKAGGGFTAGTEDISGRTAGTYNITVTDSKSCAVSATFTITEPAALTATATATSVSCYGGSDGTVALTSGGGSPSFSYTWTASGGGVVPVGQINNQSLTGLVAGTYHVSVTDSKGCNITSTATVTQPPALALSHTKIDVSCYSGSNGSVDLTVSGGTATYTYSWSTGAITEDISGLSAGPYTVLVTDANGCTATDLASVSQPPQLTAAATASPALCNGSATGSITASGSGGTGGYSYSLNGGAYQGSNIFSNLAAGIYTITIKDANNCTANVQATVTEPSALDIDGFVTDVLCNEGNSGAIDLVVTGGAGSKTYDWADIGTPGVFTDPEDRSGLLAGTYTVTVKDANGCTKTATYTIAQPNALTAPAVASNVTCKGVASGSIDLTVGGGTTNYSFAWSNGAATEDISGLAAGTYSVTVTDAHGCTATASATVTEPALALGLSAVVKDASSCDATSGSIDLTVTNGTPVNYAWSGPTTIGSVQNPTNLLAGTYSVVVTDNLGCIATLTGMTVGTAPALTVTVDLTLGNCFSTDGTAIANVLGGVAPYAYSWTPGGSTSSYITISNTSQTYSVLVTDANGCTATASKAYVAFACDPPVVFNDEFTSCSGATVSASIATNDPGGQDLEYLPLTSPSGEQGSISWNPSYNGSFVFVPATGYNGAVSVIYQAENTEGLTATGTLTIYVSQMTAQFSNTQHVQCGATNGSATVTLNPGSGFTPYSYLWGDPGATTSSAVSGLTAGTYSVTVTDNKGCSVSSTVTIYNVCLTIDKTLYSVNGNTSLTEFSAIGDLLTYHITVTNTSTTALSGIAVTDVLPGVSITGSPIVSLATGAGTTITATYSVTAGDLTAGTVTNTAIASYTYQNVSGTVSDTQTVLPGLGDLRISKEVVTTPVVAGGELIYKITVTNDGPAPARNVVISDPITAFPSPQFSLTQVGGYSNWNNPYTLPSNLAKDASHTIYIKGTLATNTCSAVGNTVTVTSDNDNNSSNNTASTTTPVNDVTPPNITCPSSQNANPTADCKAALPLFTPTVSDNCTASGSITITQSPLAGTMLPAGTYTVTITATDASDNSISCTTIFIVNENLITFTIEKSDANCFGTSTGWIKITASGGSGSYYYSKDNGVNWTSPAQSGPYTFTGLGAGDYFIRVKDTAGCEAACP